MSDKKVIVYEALHNPMTWESAAYTISIHFSKEGAEKAIAFSKKQSMDENGGEVGSFENWSIRTTEILP